MILSQLETTILYMLLDSNSMASSILRRQAIPLYAVDRNVTSKGFFLHFDVPSELALPGVPSFRLVGVTGEHSDSPGGIEFILFVNAGRISTLEGYVFGDGWPESSENIRLEYRKAYRSDDIRTLRNLSLPDLEASRVR